MSSLIKYRVKELAADFGLQPKQIVEIVALYSEKPKSNTQVLTTEELNAVFDHLTQHNQIASLEQVFAVAPKAEPAKAEAPKQPQAAKPQTQSQPQANRPAQQLSLIHI